MYAPTLAQDRQGLAGEVVPIHGRRMGVVVQLADPPLVHPGAQAADQLQRLLRVDHRFNAHPGPHTGLVELRQRGDPFLHGGRTGFPLLAVAVLSEQQGRPEYAARLLEEVDIARRPRPLVSLEAAGRPA